MHITHTRRRDPCLSVVSFALVLISLTAKSRAQDAPLTIHSTANIVFVPTQVQTKKGEMIYGLTKDRFLVEDNGVPQTINLDEDTDALGLSLVVVVQCSRDAIRQFDNMSGLPAMIDDLTGGAPRQVAVVSFGSDINLLGDFTSNPSELADNLAQVEPCDSSGANTLGAVDYAIHLFDDNKATATSRNRRAILLISEIRDHGSHITPAQVVANLGRTNTVVDAVSFEPAKTEMLDSLVHGQMGPGPIGLIVAAVNALKRNIPSTLASLSGGEYINFGSQNSFDRGVHKLANHIHNYYLLSFQPTGKNGEPVTPGLHRITVKVPDYPDAKIRTRLTYYAGDTPPPDLPDDEKKKQ
jgi:VWFA-related protein